MRRGKRGVKPGCRPLGGFTSSGSWCYRLARPRRLESPSSGWVYSRATPRLCSLSFASGDYQCSGEPASTQNRVPLWLKKALASRSYWATHAAKCPKRQDGCGLGVPRPLDAATGSGPRGEQGIQAAAAPDIAGEAPVQGAPLDQGTTPGPSSGVAPVAEPGFEEPPSPRAKQESSDSCYEPVRLVQAQPLTEEHRALPPPDFSVSMRFSIQLKDSRKEPCSARYLHAVSIEYHTHAIGDEPGSVVKADLQVLGLGGSRVVVRSPANPTLAWKLSRESQDTEREMFRIMGNWTPTRIRALGVHRVTEVGKGAAAFFVSVLEQELCAPCPQFSPSVAFELLLTVAHTAKLVQVRDLGRKNVGSRRRDSGQMGELPRDVILLVEANYWQQYNKGNRPHWPNRQRAQGLWSSLQTFTPALVPKVQELVHRFQADLESLTKEMFRLMEASLAEAEVAEVCGNLVSTQVLGISPDGQLCQYVLWNATFHSLEVGHQWGMVPIRNLSKSKLKPRAAASGSIQRP